MLSEDAIVAMSAKPKRKHQTLDANDTLAGVARDMS